MNTVPATTNLHGSIEIDGVPQTTHDASENTEEIDTAIAAAFTAAFAELPTSDPEVEGALWNDSGVLKVSAGGA